MSSLRILVVDDHEVVRRGLRALLGTRAEWEVVGEAASGREGLEKVKDLKPDVAIVDISMPEIDGFEATRLILEAAPRTQVLIFTMHKSERLVEEAMRAGAQGYVLKSEAAGDLVKALEALARHETFFGSNPGNPSSKAA
jgi:DNA-binding NarL/FixJ family response regulator